MKNKIFSVILILSIAIAVATSVATLVALIIYKPKYTAVHSGYLADLAVAAACIVASVVCLIKWIKRTKERNET